MRDEPVYVFHVLPAICEKCGNRAAYVVAEESSGRWTTLCKRHLEPWLQERRWAAVRMGSPIGDCPNDVYEAIVRDLRENGVRVIYHEKEN